MRVGDGRKMDAVGRGGVGATTVGLGAGAARASSSMAADAAGDTASRGEAAVEVDTTVAPLAPLGTGRLFFVSQSAAPPPVTAAIPAAIATSPHPKYAGIGRSVCALGLVALDSCVMGPAAGDARNSLRARLGFLRAEAVLAGT
jgi:hypothetical protein